MLKTGLRIAFLVTAIGCLPNLGFAQTKVVEKEVKVPAGQEGQIGLFGRVTPQCDNGKVTVRLAKQAVNGTVVAKPAKMKRGAVQKCPNLTPNVAVIFYQAKAGFVGEDSAVVEVESDTGAIERHEYRISVE